MTPFSIRLRDVLARALRPARPDGDPHFHGGDGGRPYVCDNPRCSSPGLDVRPR
jgi:hypothetical protein